MEQDKKMKVLISGKSGLIGSALTVSLENEGHEVWGLTTRFKDLKAKEMAWNPSSGQVDRDQLEGFDAVIHLAGRSISTRWTEKRKKEIRESRVQGTRLLAETLSKLSRKPKVFVGASAIGFYGNRGEETLDESSRPGTGYLSEVCQEWERMTISAKEAGIRTVNIRTGIVLTPQGGALAQMLLPFRMGMGGPTGPGDQWMSWISLTDEVAAIRFALTNPQVQGPINLTAPEPVRNADFAKILGKVLSRPAFMPLPSFAVKLIFGEMGQNLLLDGQKVMPKALIQSGFRFAHPSLESALRAELKKQK